jgi:2-polyprenyl-3-methyl-5-hydroxy-6-metoxy-1,4-benzoquinol methylase
MDTFNISVQRFDEFASEYAKRFMIIDSYKSLIDCFCGLIKTDKPKVLELGCGPGNITRYLIDKFPGCDCIGIDLAPNMIKIAKEQVRGVDFRIMDVRDISTLDSKFDLIMCSFCLPFISKLDTDKLITDCSARLNPNGVIYISTMEGDESKAGFETTSFSGDSKIYFNYHKQKDLENAMTNNGFAIEKIERQEYHETNGSITIDLIIIGIKK